VATAPSGLSEGQAWQASANKVTLFFNPYKMKPGEAVITAYHAGAKMKNIPFKWDMISLDSLEIEHGLDLTHIQFVTKEPIQITIVDDLDSVFHMLLASGGGYTISPKYLTLHRPKNGFFDGPNYDDIEAVRGHVLIFYKPKP
jgi:hypothetical protein